MDNPELLKELWLFHNPRYLQLPDVDSAIITRSVNSMEQNNMIKQVPGKDEQEKRIELTPGAKRYIQNVLRLQKNRRKGLGRHY